MEVHNLQTHVFQLQECITFRTNELIAANKAISKCSESENLQLEPRSSCCSNRKRRTNLIEKGCRWGFWNQIYCGGWDRVWCMVQSCKEKRENISGKWKQLKPQSRVGWQRMKLLKTLGSVSISSLIQGLTYAISGRSWATRKFWKALENRDLPKLL